MAAIFGRGKFFENWQEYISEIPCGSKISTKLLYLARLRRYKQICVLDIFVYHRPNLGINPTKKIGWWMLYHTKPPAKYERNLERNVDCRSLTSNIPHLDIFVYHRPNLDINPTKKIGWRVLYHIKPPAKFERNLERNVDCRSLTRNLCRRGRGRQRWWIHSIPASRRGYNK